MSSSALQKFEASMVIGYEQWHDGVGYDLEAIDALTAEEKAEAERLLIGRAGNDWRDLEALDRLGTANAIEAIRGVRQSSDTEIRLRAHQYGPDPSAAEWEDAILAALESAEIYAGLSSALDCAFEHSSAAVEALLWVRIRTADNGVAYHCAAALCRIKGVIASEYDDTHRPLFLRLVGPMSEEKEAAIHELRSLLDDGGKKPSSE